MSTVDSNKRKEKTYSMTPHLGEKNNEEDAYTYYLRITYSH